ncbi:MAG TPA: L-ribulose-5-phosphate 3-epimerase [bacterium]|nr:L-ribulose-5-phosphate 3-epimerase [bacterium]
MNNLLGIYEKALPKTLGWEDRFRVAADAGFDFLELSIDETPERLDRLSWKLPERLDFSRAARLAGITVPSLCLSGHRKFPFGSADPAIRAESMRIMEAAIQFAVDTGIRVIQLAGYDVYYEPSTQESRKRYLAGMHEALELAARHQVMLALEIMDTTFLNSITKYRLLKEQLPSPWLAVYPDIGNLSAWGNDMDHELSTGMDQIVGLHIKETRSVLPGTTGTFRDVPFGEGNVDFVQAFSTLSRLHYAGPFLIEMWTEKASDPIAEIARAKSWVCERLRQGGFA